MKKINPATSRKLRYGGLATVLTALIIAIVIIVNVIFGALAQKFMWYLDMTPDLVFTLSNECITLIRDGDEKFKESSRSPVQMVDDIRAQKLAEDPSFDPKSLMINIIFCTDADTIRDDTYQRLVYNTALQLQAEFPDHINVETRNIIRNPSSVSKYKINSSTQITTSDVIIEFGTESRIKQQRQFFTFDTATSTTPWAYNGEYAFASAILAVTRAETPVAYLTVGHGETYSEGFIQTLKDAGFEVKEDFNLATDEIKEDCRLIVISDPVNDLLVPNGLSNVDEVSRLADFLDSKNSLMVFMDPETPRLNNLEDFLDEWGINFNRDESTGMPLIIRDQSTSLVQEGNQNFGYTFLAEYTTGGYGAFLTEELRKNESANRIVFSNAMSISYSQNYAYTKHTPTETDTSSSVEYEYATFAKDGYTRAIYDLFVTSKNAESMSGGVAITGKGANEANRLKLMTVSREVFSVEETLYSSTEQTAFVYACGTAEFANDGYLTGSTAYGNRDLLLTVFRDVSREPVPVGLDFKPFADYTIDTITTSDVTVLTAILCVTPAIAALSCGIVVIVRRKYR